jgi:hypothetical protein
MRICVTGGRDYFNEDFVKDVFKKLPQLSFVGVGCATGLDAMVREYVKLNNIQHQVFKADWTNLGRKAGPIRNEEMLKGSKPDFLLTFIGGRGTNNCTLLAQSFGIKTIDLRDETLKGLEIFNV